MLGLATAVVLGFLLYWGGIRLNLGAFFKWTSLFICWWPQGWRQGRFALSMRRVCGTTSVMWRSILAMFFYPFTDRHAARRIFGYQETPSVSEVTMYFIYLIPALALFFMPSRPSAQPSRTAP